MKQEIITQAAPAAIGPYSQGIMAGNMVFTSGQIALDPATAALVEGGIEAQTHQVMKNLSAILTEAGCTFANVVKTTCLLANIEDFAAFNAIYATYFEAQAAPARSTFAAKALPKGALVEVEVVAMK